MPGPFSLTYNTVRKGKASTRAYWRARPAECRPVRYYAQQNLVALPSRAGIGAPQVRDDADSQDCRGLGD